REGNSMNRSHLIRHIKAHIAKGDKSRDKAEQHYVAAGQYLKTLKGSTRRAELEALLQKKVGGGNSEIPVDVVAYVASVLGISWEKAHPLIGRLAENKFEYYWRLPVPRDRDNFLIQTIERKLSGDGPMLRAKGRPRLKVVSGLQAYLFERGKEERTRRTFK